MVHVQVLDLQQKLDAETRAKQEAEGKLAAECKSFQVSIAKLGSGQSDAAVVQMKQRMWSMRSELDAVKAERDNLKKVCRR